MMTDLLPLIHERDELLASLDITLDRLRTEPLPGLEPDEEVMGEEDSEVQGRAAA